MERRRTGCGMGGRNFLLQSRDGDKRGKDAPITGSRWAGVSILAGTPRHAAGFGGAPRDGLARRGDWLVMCDHRIWGLPVGV